MLQAGWAKIRNVAGDPLKMVWRPNFGSDPEVKKRGYKPLVFLSGVHATPTESKLPYSA